jgi:hypothetical protein
VTRSTSRRRGRRGPWRREQQQTARRPQRQPSPRGTEPFQTSQSVPSSTRFSLLCVRARCPSPDPFGALATDEDGGVLLLDQSETTDGVNGKFPLARLRGRRGVFRHDPGSAGPVAPRSNAEPSRPNLRAARQGPQPSCTAEPFEVRAPSLWGGGLLTNNVSGRPRTCLSEGMHSALDR